MTPVQPRKAFSGRGMRAACRRGAWLCAVLVAGQAFAGESGAAYRARIKGATSRDLGRALKEQSRAVRLEAHPPATYRQLVRRAEEDVPRLEAVLHARGFLDGQVRVQVETNRTPFRVVFSVATGSAYTLRDVRVEYVDPPAEAPFPPELEVALERGRPAVAQAVLAEEARLLSRLRAAGFPFPVVLPRAVTLDRDRHQADIVLRVDPGPFARFGETAVEGLERLNPAYVRRRIAWTPGEAYDGDRVAALERELLRSGLFAVAAVSMPEEPEEDEGLPLTLRLRERLPRTVRLGVNYRSDIGPGAHLGWEHRNLFGGAERLALSVDLSAIERSERLVFRRPDFGSRDLALVIEQKAAEASPDAYASRTFAQSVNLEYTGVPHNTFQGGLSFKYATVDQLDREERYGLAGVPLRFTRDRRDDPVAPTSGWQWHLAGGPYKDLRSDLHFGRAFTELRTYIPVSRRDRVTLALRLAAGSLLGSSRDKVPADERFYGGGGGSVRGYAYESIGPRAEDGTPLGGQGLLETSVELRMATAGRWGYVLFADGGRVTTPSFERSDDPIFWGVGCGVRYDLGFAPLRLDVAFPVNGRSDDDPYQFYVSLGQAF